MKKSFKISSMEKNEKPTISVLMPVFNGERFLRQAMKSILEQTFSNFEFIIINDGSTDDTENIIKSYDDERIVYINNERNLGLAKSFNIGINAAAGMYLARMDADDVSVPKRLERQIQFLNKRPTVDIVGSSLQLIDEFGHKCGRYYRQLDHIDIKFSCLFSTPMMHPTVMGKTEVFKSHHYNESLTNSEDYELWSRLLFETNVQFANIHESLLMYRTYPHSFTQTLNLDKRTLSVHNTIKNIEHYIKLPPEEKKVLISLRQERDLSLVKLFKIFLIYLRAANAFCKLENLKPKRRLKIYYRLIPHAFFLTKYKIKRIIR